MSGKKILAISFVFALLVAIPLTVFFIQQEQKTKSLADSATTLSLALLTPTSNPITPGTNVTLAVNINPGSIRQVSFIKFTITYDPSELSRATGTNLVVTPWTINGKTITPTRLQGPTYDAINGKMSMTISVQGVPRDVISAPTQIASVTFDTSKLAGSTIVNIDKDKSQVLSISSSDQFNENVLNNTVPVTISTALPTATLTPTGTITPTPTTTLTPTTTITPTTIQQTTTTVIQQTIAAIGPLCTSLIANPSTRGTTPYTVNLTANGQDNNATISGVIFNFGDGQTKNVTGSAIMGTNFIRVTQPHIYNDPGSYIATTVLTDTSGYVSSIGNCKITIRANNEVIPTITSTPLEKVQSGPKDLITIGSIGAVITVIGAVLLLAL